MPLTRSCHRHASAKRLDLPLRRRLTKLAFAGPPFEYPQLNVLLHREGWGVYYKRLLRLYREGTLLGRMQR